jgi:hypothetical protein
MDSGPELISLAEGVAIFGGGNAYSWYRNQAHRGGIVFMGGERVPVVKVSGRWMISRADVAQAVETARRERAEIAQWTAEYEAGVLHEGSIELTGGRRYTFRHASKLRRICSAATASECAALPSACTVDRIVLVASSQSPR